MLHQSVPLSSGLSGSWDPNALPHGWTKPSAFSAWAWALLKQPDQKGKPPPSNHLPAGLELARHPGEILLLLLGKGKSKGFV